jgi:hypothetical protein
VSVLRNGSYGDPGELLHPLHDPVKNVDRDRLECEDDLLASPWGDPRVALLDHPARIFDSGSQKGLCSGTITDI